MGDSRQESGLGLGARLRSARKARALTVEQAAQALRLEVPILQALENEQFERLGAPVFVRGHLKAYARLLDLAEEPVLEAYRAADPGSVSPRTMTRPREAPLNPAPGPIGIAAAALVVVLGLVLYLVLADNEPLPVAPEVSPGVALTEAPAAAPAPAPVLTAPAEPAPSAPEPAGPTAAAGGNNLLLEFTAASWVEVRDRSGRLLLTGEQAAGTRQQVAGEAPFGLALGNAPGVRVSLDGVAVAIPPEAQAAGSNVARFSTGSGAGPGSMTGPSPAVVPMPAAPAATVENPDQ